MHSGSTQASFDMYVFSFPCGVLTDVAVSVSFCYHDDILQCMGSMAATLDADCGCVDDTDFLQYDSLTLVATGRAGCRLWGVVCCGCW